MPDQETMTALLGRPLTSSESTNFNTYLDIATERLEEALGIKLEVQTDPPAAASDRTFDFRRGYHTVHLDPFTSVTSVTIDDNPFTTYVMKQNDRYNGDWYNALEFDDPLYGCQMRMVVTAVWGFASLPNDLARLLAAVFAAHDNEANNVLMKWIEGAKVQYDGNSPMDSITARHLKTIQKYSKDLSPYVL